MAEIDIQRKKPSAWPWIIGALVLALVVWGMAEWFDPDEPEIADVTLEEDVAAPAEMQPMSEPAPTGDATSLVDQYQQFATNFAATDMSRQHEQTAEGIRWLLTAMGGVIQERQLNGVDVQQRFESFRQAAAEIQTGEWTADTHANEVKSVFTSATEVLDAMAEDAAQAGTGAQDALAETRQAAESLAADQPLLEQRDAVQRFFTASAQVLSGLQNGT